MYSEILLVSPGSDDLSDEAYRVIAKLTKVASPEIDDPQILSNEELVRDLGQRTVEAAEALTLYAAMGVPEVERETSVHALSEKDPEPTDPLDEKIEAILEEAEDITYIAAVAAPKVAIIEAEGISQDQA